MPDEQDDAGDHQAVHRALPETAILPAGQRWKAETAVQRKGDVEDTQRQHRDGGEARVQRPLPHEQAQTGDDQRHDRSHPYGALRIRKEFPALSAFFTGKGDIGHAQRHDKAEADAYLHKQRHIHAGLLFVFHGRSLSLGKPYGKGNARSTHGETPVALPV